VCHIIGDNKINMCKSYTSMDNISITLTN